jgi:hypothetical protein
VFPAPSSRTLISPRADTLPATINELEHPAGELAKDPKNLQLLELIQLLNADGAHGQPLPCGLCACGPPLSSSPLEYFASFLLSAHSPPYRFLACHTRTRYHLTSIDRARASRDTRETSRTSFERI